MSLLSAIFGDANKRIVTSFQPIVEKINSLESALAKKNDDEMKSSFLMLAKKYDSQKNNLDELLPEVFAYVREASKRTIGQRHFDVQLIGGMVLHQGKISEMKTGEGKTLVATLAVTLNAIPKMGVHVITVNDYLAKRDARWMGSIYHFLGFTTGVIQHESAFMYDPDYKNSDESYANLKPVSRKEAYACDITYGTNNEYGFDFLRDNMAPAPAYVVQRNLHYAIIDEVDSILIDEARTPLIISAPAAGAVDTYFQYATFIEKLKENEHYNIDEKMRAVTLTEDGIRQMEKNLNVENIYTAGGIEMAHHIEQALRARALFKKDKDYVVKDGEVIIVDEFTGRLMHGRRYSEGLHQAIEAKERVQIKEESQTLATITFQNYFRLYRKIAGMTGTAATEAEEFSKIYNLDVIEVPTNKPIQRQDANDRIYKNENGKFMAVIKDIALRHETGQPILVGTISIERNEIIAQMLKREGIPYEVLNAKNHEREAQIIKNAGKKGAVTLATNMAGRGVDIVLGGTESNESDREEIKKLGGLHVVGTERHEARRIDNQLRGRSGRQGDPGSTQFYVSMEDDLMRIFGSERMKGIMERMGIPDDMPIENRLISKSIESAQKKVEGHNFDIRKHLVEYDDVINKHRDVIYKKRRAILFANENSDESKNVVHQMIDEEIEKVINFHSAAEVESTWNVEEMYEVVDTIFPVELATRMKLEDIIKNARSEAPKIHAARDALVSYVQKLSRDAYNVFERRFENSNTVRTVERAVLLRAIDTLWIEHLSLIDYLRQGIQLRGYGQRDPLIEYKKEAFRLFSELIENIRHTVVYSIFKIQPTNQPHNEGIKRVMVEKKDALPTQAAFSQSAVSEPVTTQKTPEGEKIGRNDPCWCGSGKKYKKCHGA